MTRIACGKSHCLSVLEDGSVSGWGHNGWGRSTSKWPPQLGGRAIAVAGGGTHSVALLEDGCVVGWGHNLAGQAATPAGVNAVGARTVAAGTAFSVALLNNGDVAVWGSGLLATPTTITGATHIAAGEMHFLALLADGSILAHGRNNHGEASIPPHLKSQKAVAIAAGCYKSLAITADGVIHAWGAYSYDTNFRPPPPQKNKRPVDIACGARHSVVLYDNGTVLAWGDNSRGQCDVPPMPEGVKVVAISAGEYHSAASLSHGGVMCWGDDTHGQLSPPCFNKLRVMASPSNLFREQHRRGLVSFVLWQTRLAKASSKLYIAKTGSINRLLPTQLHELIALFVLSAPRIQQNVQAAKKTTEVQGGCTLQ